MSDDLVEMARLAQHDERMATGALYGDLADRIEELEAKLAQQDDLVQAAVAAKLREAVAAVKKDADNDDISSGAAQWVSDTILALITPDAQAALGRVAARVAAAERERIVSIYRKLATGSAVGAGDGDTFAVRYVDPEQFAAAIREGGE